MKAIPVAILSPIFSAVIVLALSSCGQSDVDEEDGIMTDNASGFRRPAVPIDESYYPENPKVAGRSSEPVVVRSRSYEPDAGVAVEGGGKGSALMEEAISIAMKNAPAILEKMLKESGGEAGGIADAAPELLESILNSEGGIPPEIIDGAIAEAPAIIEGILSQQSEKSSDSVGGAITDLIFRKILESASGGDNPAPTAPRSNY